MTVKPARIIGGEYAALFLSELNVYAPAGCLSLFPQFQEDFNTLLVNKVLEIDCKKFKWNYSLTSLGQYFCYLKDKPGYYWAIVETDFNIKRGTLKHLISENKRRGYGKDCKDYIKIKELLKPRVTDYVC